MMIKIIPPLITSCILTTLLACSESTSILNIQCDNALATVKINPSTIGFSLGEKHYQLKQRVSASGSKYQNEQVTVWLKGDDAMIIINQVKLKNCKLINIHNQKH